LGKTINIKYYTANDAKPTMVFSGTKRSIVKLGRVLFTLAKCEYTKEVLRALLSVRSTEKIKVVIKEAEHEKDLQRINGDHHEFDWPLTREKWRDFSSLIARFRSGKIDSCDIDPSYYNNLDLMITMGNRVGL